MKNRKIKFTRMLSATIFVTAALICLPVVNASAQTPDAG